MTEEGPERDEEPREENESESSEGQTSRPSSGAVPALETFPPHKPREEEKQVEPSGEDDGEETGPREDVKAAVEAALAEERKRSSEELIKAKEKMLRVAADFENFRKRARKDQDEAVRSARVEILKEMLPVFDNLARAVEHGESVEDIQPVIEGAQMVTRQFEDNLAKFGLKRVKAVGEVFDPMMHEAIAQEDSTEVEPGVVVKEFLAGYVLGERLLRASMVVVARRPEEKK